MAKKSSENLVSLEIEQILQRNGAPTRETAVAVHDKQQHKYKSRVARVLKTQKRNSVNDVK